jgi:hypothetical protein
MRPAYRKFKDGGRVRPDGTVAGTLHPDDSGRENSEAPEVSIKIDTDAPAAEVDDASIAFQKQIDALRKSEQLAKDRAAAVPMAAPNLSREERAQRIREAGASPEHISFLLANPRMLDGDGFNTTAKAHWQAIEAGHEVDSPEYFRAVKSAFNNMVSPPEDVPEPVVKRKAAKVESDYDSPNSRSMISAPVSRDWGTTATSGAVNGERPGQVHMTVAMKEAARISGLTDREYAEQVLELRRRKSEGDYGGSA